MQPYTAQEIIDLTNEYRKANNLPLLKVDKALMVAAQQRADDMATTNSFSHTVNGNAKGFTSFIDKSGYKRQYAGENLAKGFNSAAEVLDALKKSPTHNANLIKQNYQDTGVAVVRGTGEDASKYYVIQLFGNQVPSKTVIPPTSITLKAPISTITPLSRTSPLYPTPTGAPVPLQNKISVTAPAPIQKQYQSPAILPMLQQYFSTFNKKNI